jgi:hypothetical protein
MHSLQINNCWYALPSFNSDIFHDIKMYDKLKERSAVKTVVVQNDFKFIYILEDESRKSLNRTYNICLSDDNNNTYNMNLRFDDFIDIMQVHDIYRGGTIIGAFRIYLGADNFTGVTYLGSDKYNLHLSRLTKYDEEV